MSLININSELKKTIPWKLVVIFLFFSAAIILLGAFYYKLQRVRVFKEQQNNLSAIASLNELRQKKNTAFNRRLPLTDKDLLASKAVKGFEGVVEGTDYRNIPVVDFLTRIPDLPWYIVAKVDKEKILSPLKKYVFLIIIVIVLLILINASVFGFWVWAARKKAEEALSESEDKFKYVFDHSVIGKSITLPSGEIHVNEAFCDMLGYTQEELEKTKWQIISHSDDIDLTQKNLNLLLTGENDSVRFIKRYIHKNCSVVWADVGTALRRDKEGKPLYFITAINNITDRKNAESQIKKLNEELEGRVILRTEQLASANKELEAFSYSVSHDLRAPLRSVHGFTKILIEDYESKLDDEGKRICGIISSSATQMGELIDDLLSFSRIGRSILNPSLVDMKKMAGLLFEGMTSPSERGRIKLKIGKLHQAFGDVTLLGQVWINLISNAIKYSSNEISSEILIGSRIEGEMIIYFVKDNGVGFDMQYAHKLFGVFQRLHSEAEFEGNGVGLAIVQRIILKHGGKVWAEGEVGKGATFYFSLPADGVRSKK